MTLLGEQLWVTWHLALQERRTCHVRPMVEEPSLAASLSLPLPPSAGPVPSKPWAQRGKWRQLRAAGRAVVAH